MRPIGGFFFGLIGDKKGRKRSLLLSIIFMAIPTTLVGILPTHSQWGWLAAALLVLLRLLQGFSVGGEFTGSITFLVEAAPPGKRGLFGSWSTLGVIGGMLLGSGVGTLITCIFSEQQVYSFGWRIPFLVGSLVGLAGLFLRKKMKAEDAISKLREKADIVKSPMKELWHGYKKTLGKVILINWGFAVSVYLVFIYLTSYLHGFLDIPMHIALSANTIAMVLLMLLIPLMGKLSDLIGRKPPLLTAFLAFMVFSLPLFTLFHKQTFFMTLLPLLMFAVFESALQGAIPATMAEMFPTRIRDTGLSLGYNIALAIFGGTTPLVATWLIKISGKNTHMPALYLIFATAIGFIAVIFCKETKS
jgi:MHS family proline/betaine transporter-like MFS transporter